MEVFKTVEGAENYEVSDNGNVRNKITGRVLRNKTDRGGYQIINIVYYGVQRSIRPHRLCAIAFVENPNNYPCVNHKDGNKKNNKASNLEWCTVKQNNIHAILCGLNKPNTAHLNNNAKLTRENVAEIKTRLLNGDRVSDISKDFGVKRTTIYCIKSGKNWSHVTI